eukprot:scaffold207758_cov31-Attheya_sp.AAC.1
MVWAILAAHIVESYPSGHVCCNTVIQCSNLGVDISQKRRGGPATNLHDVFGCIAVEFECHGTRNTGKKVARAISNTVRPTYVSGIHAVAGLGEELLLSKRVA